jgi:hypothetical protein
MKEQTGSEFLGNEAEKYPPTGMYYDTQGVLHKLDDKFGHEQNMSPENSPGLIPETVINPETRKSPEASEVVAGLALIGIGIFAAKKVWDWKGMEIKGKIDVAASSVIDRVIKHAEGKLDQVLGLNQEGVATAFRGGTVLAGDRRPGNVDSAQTDRERLEQQLRDRAKKAGLDEDEFIRFVMKPKDGNDTPGVHSPKGGVGDTREERDTVKTTLESIGVDFEGASKTPNLDTTNIFDFIKPEFYELIDKRNSKFANLADVDPNLSKELQDMDDQSQGEVMEIIRTLKPEDRAKLSMAFLKINLMDGKEGAPQEQKVESPREKPEDIIMSPEFFKRATRETILGIHRHIADAQYNNRNVNNHLGEYRLGYFGPAERGNYGKNGVGDRYEYSARQALENYRNDRPEEYKRLYLEYLKKGSSVLELNPEQNSKTEGDEDADCC